MSSSLKKVHQNFLDERIFTRNYLALIKTKVNKFSQNEEREILHEICHHSMVIYMCEWINELKWNILYKFIPYFMFIYFIIFKQKPNK